MSDDEIRAWLEMLGGDLVARHAAVRDLLLHAGTDEMSMADRRVCRRALELLERDARWPRYRPRLS